MVVQNGGAIHWLLTVVIVVWNAELPGDCTRDIQALMLLRPVASSSGITISLAAVPS